MNKGFTLMEAILAIFVITTGLVGVLSLVSQTIASSTFSKDKLIAAYLAQEGIEIVRNIRDTNWLQNLDWNSGLAVGIYEADYDSQWLSIYSGNPLNLESLTNYYGYGLGDATKFTRKITISEPATASCPASDCLNVKVEVSWQERGNPCSVEAQENLYNWK
jgi:hypothetical protein